MSSDATPAEDETENTSPEESTPVEGADVASGDSPAETLSAEEPIVEAAVLEEPTAPPPETQPDLPEITLGAGDIADPSADTDYVPVLRGKIDRFGVAMGTGRRKTSVARVRIKLGSGQFLINNRTLEAYFGVERDREMVRAPLKLAEKLDNVDVFIRVNGGGTTGQTGAIVLGVSRALEVLDPALHQRLSEAGYLTRDGRMVERKKYGLRKARRSFQFSKR